MPDYVPNKLRCAKCSFELERLTMNANTGAVGIGTNEPERCPNGCGPLWRVTWEQEAQAYAKSMNDWADRAIAAEKALRWTAMTPSTKPLPGALIVKRWKANGAVWAGVYSGTDKDSSFDEWFALPADQVPGTPNDQQEQPR